MRLSRIWRILQIKEIKCYQPRLKAEVDSTLQDLQNSSYPAIAKFNIALLFIQNNSNFKNKLKMLTSVDVKFTSIVYLLREIVHKGLLNFKNKLKMLTSVDVKFTSIVHLLREIVHKGLLRSANILQIADVVRRVDFSLFLLCF